MFGKLDEWDNWKSVKLIMGITQLSTMGALILLAKDYWVFALLLPLTLITVEVIVRLNHKLYLEKVDQLRAERLAREAKD